jgi:hypothetical protein
MPSLWDPPAATETNVKVLSNVIAKPTTPPPPSYFPLYGGCVVFDYITFTAAELYGKEKTPLVVMTQPE